MSGSISPHATRVAAADERRCTDSGERVGAEQPRVAVTLHRPSALKLLLKPSAGKLAQAYVEGTARNVECLRQHYVRTL